MTEKGMEKLQGGDLEAMIADDDGGKRNQGGGTEGSLVNPSYRSVEEIAKDLEKTNKQRRKEGILGD